MNNNNKLVVITEIIWLAQKKPINYFNGLEW